jgi:hypothetical protein
VLLADRDRDAAARRYRNTEHARNSRWDEHIHVLYLGYCNPRLMFDIWRAGGRPPQWQLAPASCRREERHATLVHPEIVKDLDAGMLHIPQNELESFAQG